MTAVTYGPSTVHKFDVIIGDEPTLLAIPATAKVVHVEKQSPSYQSTVQLWAIVPVGPNGKPLPSASPRWFHVYGTGHAIPGGREHVGSTFDNGFVWHVFEDVSERRQ